MSLSKIERRACEILLAAARRKATVSDFREDLHRREFISALGRLYSRRLA